MAGRYVRIAAVLLVSACLIALLSNEQALARLDRHLALAILAAQAPLVIAQAAMAWRLTLLVPAGRLTVVRALRASLLAQGADIIFPWRLAEFVKLAYLGERAGLSIADSMAGIALERITDAMIVGILVALAAALVVTDADAVLASVVVIVLLLALRLLPWLQPLISRVIEWLPFPALRALGNSSTDAAVQRIKDGAVWRALIPGAIAWCGGLAATWVFLTVAGYGASANVPTGAEVLLSLFVATTLGSVVALLPASVGTYEAGVVLVLGAHGMPIAESLPLAFGLHGAHLLLGAVGAALVAMAEPLGVTGLARRALAMASVRAQSKR